ncbi:MAG: helix-turn-helix transcriptional regulator [Bacteroidales bacterium]|nr:helix-turn-helix transcriptional regulator [Bacteroidales bacterium]
MNKKNLFDDESMLKILPGKLKEFRKRNGLTIYDVANEVGRNASSISLWEKGKALPDVYILLKLCRLYNLESIEQLLQPTEMDKNALTKGEVELVNLYRGADKKSRDAAKLLLRAAQKEV